MTIAPFDGSLVDWAVLIGALLFASGLIWAGAVHGAFPASTLGSIVFVGALAWFAPLYAQTSQELVDQVNKRAAALQEDLRRWMAQQPTATDRQTRDAQALVDGNTNALKRGLGMLDAKEFPDAQSMGDLQSAPREGVVYVAVSFSMPASDLRRLARDANRAGATLVIRGLVNGSFKETLAATKQVFDETSPNGMSIDPGVFRSYGITQVPVFIAAKRPIEPCGGGLDCVSPQPPSDQVKGNVSLEAALEILSKKGRQAPDVAQGALRRLRS